MNQIFDVYLEEYIPAAGRPLGETCSGILGSLRSTILDPTRMHSIRFHLVSYLFRLPPSPVVFSLLAITGRPCFPHLSSSGRDSLWQAEAPLWASWPHL